MSLSSGRQLVLVLVRCLTMRQPIVVGGDGKAATNLCMSAALLACVPPAIE